MRSGGIVFVSAVLAVASPCVALAQPPPELPRNVNVADCADAMRKVHAAEPQQLLGETTYFPQVVPVEGKPNTFRFTVVPNATFIYDFIWPNMSAAEQAAVRRHLPALRAHEARHWDIAVAFAEKTSLQVIHPTDKFTVQDFLDAMTKKLEAEQKAYDQLTFNGKTQVVLGPEWENLVFNCWPIHVLSQSYQIQVDASATEPRSPTPLRFIAEAAKFSVMDVRPLASTLGAIATTLSRTRRRAQPEITRSSVGLGRGNETSAGPWLTLGESMTPIHRVEMPGGGAARAGLDVRFDSNADGFVIDGIVGLDTTIGGSAVAYERSSATLEMNILLGSPSAAFVRVSDCDVFDKERLSVHVDYEEDGTGCSFRMSRLGALEEFVAALPIAARAVAESSPGPRGPKSQITRSFTIRITEKPN